MSNQPTRTVDDRSSSMRTRESVGSTDEKAQRPALASVLLWVIFFQGISGIAGGIGLLMDPTGATLGIPQEWLAGSYFPDYTVPGIVLLTLLGVLPLVGFYGLLVGKQWGWFASLYVGLALLAWLFVEILTIGYQAQPPLQLVYGVVALVILAVALAPSVRRYYGVGKPAK